MVKALLIASLGSFLNRFVFLLKVTKKRHIIFMLDEKMEPRDYENTICFSKEESLLKAVDILLEELDSAPKQTIHRPTIDYWRMGACFIAWISPILLTPFLLKYFELSRVCCRWITILVALIISAVFLKRITIYLILIYQRFAPERIRSSCVFEPSCSNYMLQAIEKYGIFRGLFKGVRRLLRCHYPNGGIDYP